MFAIIFNGADIRIPGQLAHYGITSPSGRLPAHVLFSVSFSRGTSHPHAARDIPQRSGRRRRVLPADPRLSSIGIRIFGIHPETGQPFDAWMHSSDYFLGSILKEMDAIKDQNKLEDICRIGLEKNLAREWWNGRQEDLDSIER
jgi:hypothetical protein